MQRIPGRLKLSAKIAVLFLVVGLVGFGPLGFAGSLGFAGASAAGPWRAKVDESVLRGAANGSIEFIVFLAKQADLSEAARLSTRTDKGSWVFRTLRDTAQRSQGGVIQALQALGVPYRPYWVANMIWVRGDLGTIEAMAARPDVAQVYANPAVRMSRPIVDHNALEPEATQGIEWNISHINAPALWQLGHTGEGVVLGGQDTGYQWDHPALINQYRGWDGQNEDHDYNWHDAIHSGGGVCGADSPFPCDDNDHGTHTMGTMVGDDGAGNRIGVAPGARWIGCRNMNRGVGTPITYAECYQWFIAPTRVDGSDPDPSKAPHAINNSWSCPPSEGCTNPDVLLTVVENVRAAGILTVHAAGNEGPGCSSVSDPAAIYDASMTVAATSNADGIASFSSRGPVLSDGSGRMKPDISAPGVNIRSSVPGGGYAGGWNGTSMASPHIAGVAALLISAQPAIAGNVAALEQAIALGAVPLTSSQGCGGDGPDDVPNNSFGWGRVDALAAFQTLAPVPHIRANGSTGPITLAPGDRLEVDIGLEAAREAGQPLDYWMIAGRRWGQTRSWYHYKSATGLWYPGIAVSYQGPGSDLASFRILDNNRLPAAEYQFFFAVDTVQDGKLSFPQSVWDSVLVNIAP